MYKRRTEQANDKNTSEKFHVLGGEMIKDSLGSQLSEYIMIPSNEKYSGILGQQVISTKS